MSITLPPEAQAVFEQALTDQAAALVSARLYTGTESIEFFKLTRASLKYITPTMLPGRTKPLYSAGNITAYLKSREGRKA